jgi:hypothetical protein
MKRTEMLGIGVALTEDQIIMMEFLGEPRFEKMYRKGTVLIVEHDFRNSEENGIHVGFPDGKWAALTSGQFAELFGGEALARLDAITYDE